jgi:hydroxyethylthiazole kinase-like uncharacterized protein yjeF
MDPAAHRRFGALTRSEIAALDAAATSAGVDVMQLMEVAGFQVARLAWRMIGSKPNRVHVVAGHGNNGGDGLVAARHLAASGCTVSAAVLREPDRLPELIDRQAAAARGAGVAISASADPRAVLGDGDVVLTIDALLGTGLSQPPRAPHAEVIEGMRGVVLSVDVPSGLDADDGLARGAAVHASATCTLTGCKRGFWIAAAAVHTGAVYVADIGMPLTAWAAAGLTPPSAVRGGALRRVPVG